MASLLKTTINCHRDYRLKITYTATAVAGIEFTDPTPDKLPTQLPYFLLMLAEKMSRYFQGQQVDFDPIPLSLDSASLFQQRVWQMVKRIPYGSVASYQEIANSLGKRHGARAVGNTLATNPILIIIPCHRVLTSTGKIGGYKAGIACKEKLLAMERQHKPLKA